MIFDEDADRLPCLQRFFVMLIDGRFNLVRASAFLIGQNLRSHDQPDVHVRQDSGVPGHCRVQDFNNRIVILGMASVDHRLGMDRLQRTEHPHRLVVDLIVQLLAFRNIDETDGHDQARQQNGGNRQCRHLTQFRLSEHETLSPRTARVVIISLVYTS